MATATVMAEASPIVAMAGMPAMRRPAMAMTTVVPANRTALPEVALADRLTADSCSLDGALEHMMQFVYDQVPGLDLVEEGGILEDNVEPTLKRKREDASWLEQVGDQRGS
jgi:hypothetical protein